MLAFVVCLSVLAAVSASRSDAAEYEEDPTHFSEQNILEMVGLSVPLCLYKRKFYRLSKARCQCATKVSMVDEAHYIYNFTRREQRKYFSFIQDITLSKTGNHTNYNAATFFSEKGPSPKIRKLMTMDDKMTCFVFVEIFNEFIRGCQLVLTEESARKKKIAKRCKTVYEKQCYGRSTTFYKSDCIKLQAAQVYS